MSSLDQCKKADCLKHAWRFGRNETHDIGLVRSPVATADALKKGCNSRRCAPKQHRVDVADVDSEFQGAGSQANGGLAVRKCAFSLYTDFRRQGGVVNED